MARRLPFTREPWNSLIRLGCLAVYAAGLAGVARWLPTRLAAPAAWLAVFVLAAHAVQLALMRRHVGLYRGRLVTAIVLALLFGSAHWFPLLELQGQRDPE